MNPETEAIRNVLMPLAQSVLASLGPGHCEGTYQAALVHNLCASGYTVGVETALPLYFTDCKGVRTQVGGNHSLRTDIMLPGMQCVVELKSTAKETQLSHCKQALRYMLNTTDAFQTFVVLNFISPADATTTPSVQMDVLVRSSTDATKAAHFGPFTGVAGSSYNAHVTEGLPPAPELTVPGKRRLDLDAGCT